MFVDGPSLLGRLVSKTFRLDIMLKQTIIWEVIWSVGLVPFNIGTFFFLLEWSIVRIDLQYSVL
jgi:hypothetical protein